MPPTAPARDPAAPTPLMRRAGLDSAAAIAAFDHRKPIDRFGDRIHLACGLFACFCIAGPINVLELAAFPLITCFFIRLWFIRRCKALLLLQWPFLLFVAFLFWHAAGALWSPDPVAAADHWEGMHIAAFVFMLFPLVRHRNALVLAVAAGFLCGNASQVLRAIGTSFDIPALLFRAPSPGGRNGGWWPEVIGGEILVAALGLHLPAALLATTWTRIRALALAATAITLLGIAATGTRAAWIAAAALVAGAILTAIRRLPSRRAKFAIVGVAAVASILLASISALAFGDALSRRWTDARNEIARMVDKGEYHTNNGLRVKMAIWAWEAFKEHPITGTGAGGYRAFVLSKQLAATGNERAAIDLFDRQNHEHCHNAPLQLLATTGIVGFVFLVGALAGSVLAAFRLFPGEYGTYSHGPAWGIVGMLLIAPFDAIYISVQPAAALFVLIALCPAWRPPPKASV